MNEFHKLVPVTLAFLFLFMAFGGMSTAGTGAGATRAGDDASATTWTFMVYMDGDNNLEGASIEDFNEIESVGSSDKVNILVLHDRIEGQYDTSNGDVGDTRLYLAQRDNDTSIISSTLLEKWGEMDMGDPNTLIRFVSYCIDNYPAEHYLIDLWDHGGAWYGTCWDDSSTDDNGKTDRLSLADLNYAMEGIHDHLGRKIDVLGFDACLMAGVAMLYEVGAHADYVIASGFVEPGDGWPYETVLMRLVNVPDMSPEELGDYIAKAYVDSYSDRVDDPQDTRQIVQTCFRTMNFDTFVMALERFSMYLASHAGDWSSEIYQARAATTGYDMASIGPYDLTGYAEYDVIGFTLNLEARIPADSKLRELSSDLRTATNNIISASYVDVFHSYMPNKAYGLTIYFPNRDQSTVPGSTSYDQRFDELHFAKERYWDDMLQTYYKMRNGENIPPSVIFDYPSAYNITVDADIQDDLVITIRTWGLGAITSVAVSVDGGSYISASRIGSSSLWSYDIAIQGLLPGKHYISITATNEGTVTSSVITNTFTLHGDTQASDELNGGADTGSGFKWTTLVGFLIVIFALVGILILVKDRLSKHKRQG